MARNRLNVVNSIPVLGHIKGIIQRIIGDEAAADQAFTEANRTTAVLAAGAAGFYLAGVPFAIVFSTAAGVEWDLGSIFTTHGERIQGICHIIEDPSNLNAWIDATMDVANDGITGVRGGRIAEAAGNVTFGAVFTNNSGEAAGEETSATENFASKTGSS